MGVRAEYEHAAGLLAKLEKPLFIGELLVGKNTGGRGRAPS